MKNTVFFIVLWVSAGRATVVWLVHVIRVHNPLSTKFSTFLFSRKLNFIIQVTIDCIAQKHTEVFGRSSGDPVASSCGLRAVGYSSEPNACEGVVWSVNAMNSKPWSLNEGGSSLLLWTFTQVSYISLSLWGFQPSAHYSSVLGLAFRITVRIGKTFRTENWASIQQWNQT